MSPALHDAPVVYSVTERQHTYHGRLLDGINLRESRDIIGFVARGLFDIHYCPLGGARIKPGDIEIQCSASDANKVRRLAIWQWIFCSAA